jgi:hypothetical protein
MTQKAPMSKPLTVDEIRAQHEINGARRANADLIAYALDRLKPGEERSNVERLAAITLEREQTITALRRLAEQYVEYFDDKWEGLSVPEIIEKHIALPISAILAKAPEKSPEKSKR